MSMIVMNGTPPELGVPFRISPPGYFPRYAPVHPSLGLRHSGLGQAAILDNRLVSFLSNTGATVIGVMAGVHLGKIWSTVGWVVAVVAGLRALNDFSAMVKRTE
jgi:hypothetical protein